jgi:hypothetical protein
MYPIYLPYPKVPSTAHPRTYSPQKPAGYGQAVRLAIAGSRCFGFKQGRYVIFYFSAIQSFNLTFSPNKSFLVVELVKSWKQNLFWGGFFFFFFSSTTQQLHCCITIIFLILLCWLSFKAVFETFCIFLQSQDRSLLGK